MSVVASSGIVIIEDSFECRGTTFLMAVLQNILRNSENVLIISTELNHNCFFDSFSAVEIKKLKFLSLYEQPIEIENDFLNSCQDRLQADNNTALVIDSLFPLIVNFGLETTIRWLNKIHTTSKVPILSVVHRYCINSDQTNQLQWLASTWYNLRLHEKTAKILIDSRTVKKSGQVRRKTSILNIRNDLAITLLPVGFMEKDNISPSPNSSVDKKLLNDRTSNLTFNVGIKESELNAKNNLILPFIKSQNEKETGQVVYIPDKEDDLDEEDPDDDLDF